MFQNRYLTLTINLGKAQKKLNKKGGIFRQKVNIFIDVSAHLKHILPLKSLENLHQFGPQRRRNPHITPSPPLPLPEKGKIFFAFLDVSDHLEAKKI